jgi:energy-coupling factor transporter ATP-binding protein EcfA2
VRDAVTYISLDVYDNEFLVILGPGHCGKSVLLNIIGGLEPPVGATSSWTASGSTGNDKRISMVFQRWPSCHGRLSWERRIRAEARWGGQGCTAGPGAALHRPGAADRIRESRTPTSCRAA